MSTTEANPFAALFARLEQRAKSASAKPASAVPTAADPDWWRRSDLPARHAQKVGHETGEAWLAARAGVLRLLGRGAQVALLGPYGSGKTQILVNVCRAWQTDPTVRGEGPARAVYVPLPDLLLRIRATYAPGARQTEADILRDLESAGLVCLDEESARRGGSDRDWDGALIRQLVDRRYRLDNRPTIIASNAPTPEAFAASVGGAVWDRVRETGGVVIASWEGFRG